MNRFHRSYAIVPAALLLGALLSGCEGGVDADPRFSNVCDRAEVSACDIRVIECQRRIHAYAACLTEREPKDMPSVRILAETATVTFRPAHSRLDAARAGLSLLGLANRTPSPEQRASSWYDGGSKEIFIVDRGQAFSSAKAVRDLGVLMTFALQFSSGDAEALFAHDDGAPDRGLALEAVRQGEGLLVGDLFQRALGASKGFPGLGGEGPIGGDSDHVPAPLEARRASFIASEGFPFLWKFWVKEGNSGTRELFRDPPESTAEIISVSRSHGGDPDAALAERRAERTRIEGAPSLPSALETYRHEGDVVVGAWGRILFQGLLLEALLNGSEGAGAGSDAYSWVGALSVETWNGDRLWSYKNTKTGGRAFVWVLPASQRGPQLNAGLSAAIERLGAPYRFLEGGSASVLVGSDDPTELQTWLEVGAAFIDAEPPVRR